MSRDLRRVVGESVHARAWLITAESECKRLYGSHAKTKLVDGTVNGVVTKTTAKGNQSTFIEAVWVLHSRKSVKRLVNIRSVKQGPVPREEDSEDDDDDSPAPPNQPPAGNTQPPARSTNSDQSNQSPLDSLAEAASTAASATSPRRTTNAPSTPQQPTRRTSPRRHHGSPVASPHDFDWHRDDEMAYRDISGMGGHLAHKEWGLKTPIGEILRAGCDKQKQRSKLDYFLLLFPPALLQLIVRETNKQLRKHGRKETTAGEILQFFGILILGTRFQFSDRRSLWSTRSKFQKRPAPCFGQKTNMGRKRFDDLFRFIRWSAQPDERPAGMSHADYRWRLVDDFVDLFNAHRVAYFDPSEILTVDESIARWYGLGGDWINIALTFYVAMDRKPENGCEIQDVCCGRSGVMLRLKLVKRPVPPDAQGPDDHLPHGGKVLKELIMPWAMNRNDRIVCADSYFSSVATALELQRMHLWFIGVVKTASKKFPQAYLASLEMQERGDRIGVIHKDRFGRPELLAFVYMDRDRQYFITTCSSLEDAPPAIRHRWRQVDETEDAEPERVEIELPQPKAAAIYYSANGKIDQINRIRQDDLQLERKFVTQNWAMRVGMSLLGVVVVDTFNVYSQCTQSMESKDDFFTDLAEQLIDNTYDGVDAQRTRRSPSTTSSATSSPASSVKKRRAHGVGAHLTPCKRPRRNKDKKAIPNTRDQLRCCYCSKRKSSWCCSVCIAEGVEERKCHICPPTDKQGNPSLCWNHHYTEKHADAPGSSIFNTRGTGAPVAGPVGLSSSVPDFQRAAASGGAGLQNLGLLPFLQVVEVRTTTTTTTANNKLLLLWPTLDNRTPFVGSSRFGTDHPSWDQ